MIVRLQSTASVEVHRGPMLIATLLSLVVRIISLARLPVGPQRGALGPISELTLKSKD